MKKKKTVKTNPDTVHSLLNGRTVSDVIALLWLYPQDAVFEVWDEEFPERDGGGYTEYYELSWNEK